MVSNHLSEKERERERRNLTEIPHLGSGSELIRGERTRRIYGDQNNNVLYISTKIGNGPIVDLEYIYLRKVHMYVNTYADST